MPVSYNSNAIIPAPYVSVVKEYQTTDDGNPIGTLYLITLKGKLISWQGSPNSSGTFWTSSGNPPDESNLTTSQWMGSLLQKQFALRALFGTPGLTFNASGPDGSAPLSCNPRVRGIEIPEGNWTQDCDYTITLEADVLYRSGAPVEDPNDPTNYKVSKATEQWTIEIIDEHYPIYRLSHSLSATGKRFYNSSGSLVQAAWQNAQDYVLNRLPLGLQPSMITSSQVVNAGSLNAYNYFRIQQVDEQGGVYGVTETWLCYDPPDGIAAYEEINGTVRYAVQDGRHVVNLEGTITGLQVSNNTSGAITSTRYTNAQAKWAAVQPLLLSRAQTIAGFTLNPTPMSQLQGVNQTTGVITYAYEYDTRVVPTIPGAIWQIVTIANQNAAELVAEIPIPGRGLGPVIQDLDTITKKGQTVTIEARLPMATISFTPTKPDTTAIMTSYAPTGTVVWVQSDEETWTANDGHYQRVTNWGFE